MKRSTRELRSLVESFSDEHGFSKEQRRTLVGLVLYDGSVLQYAAESGRQAHHVRREAKAMQDAVGASRLAGLLSSLLMASVRSSSRQLELKGARA